MRGLMGDLPLALDRFLWRAENLHPEKEIVSATAAGKQRTTYGSWVERVDRIGPVLDTLGISADGRVGTFCWSTEEHLELFFGVPVTGRVIHPINVRLSPEQMAFVIDAAQDEVVFADRSLVEQLLPVLDSTPTVRHLVIVEDGSESVHPDAGIPVHHYRELMSAVEPRRATVADEWQAAALSNTTGSTGNPKGVVHTHRSLVLHTMGTMFRGWAGVDERDVLLPMVPMFHANSLTFPHAAVATGATLVLPGSDFSGAALASLMESEEVTATVGVPTHFTMTLPHLEGRVLPALRINLCGSSAVPPSLSAAYQATIGVPLTQGWGMSEAGPISTLLPASKADAAPAELERLRVTAGTPLPGAEVRLVGVDGQLAPWDGSTGGELQVRGPSVASEYLGGDAEEAFTEDGWLRTGDIATMDAHGYLRIVDRIKDVIKSGGEWISSISIELAAVEHPAVADAAAIGVPHEKWGERPVLFVTAAGGDEAAGDLPSFLAERLERWWIPEEILWIDSIPRNNNGKIDKRNLRERRLDAGSAPSLEPR